MLYRTAPAPTLARFERPRAARRTRLLVASDPHVSPTERGTWKLYHRSEQRLRTAVTEANRRDVDALVIPGDLTKDGAREEFARVGDLLGSAEAPVLAVPGNHDVPKTFDGVDTPPVTRFVDRYTPGTMPYVRRVEGVDVVGVNSASAEDGSLADHHLGAVSDEQLDWLEAMLPGLETPVVVMHHNLSHASSHTGQFPNADFYRTTNHRELAGVLAEGGASLVLSGHIHWPATATVRGVREVIAPATCSLPQAALLLEVGPRGTRVDLVPLAGRAGFEEAYAYADAGAEHGQALADCLDRGVLAELPATDEWDEHDADRPADRQPAQ